ncbi:hypothetical protein HK100_004121 [Physocladia obscura]|uniref:DUF300-domain-containing protein n=1 Tax=Physocladia obscura TaxID=109957 RepID=A0AAD5T7G6_9FUNG|nr:hypothetical protein HK100_004121 [Physocladia obscura]
MKQNGICFLVAALAGFELVVGAAVSTAVALNSTVPQSCEDNPQFIDQGSGFDMSLDRDNASWAWIATGVFAVGATIFSFFLIGKHLRNFNNPLEQVHIVRVLLIVPIYSIVSWFAFRYYWRAVYFFTVRDVYESFTIYSFYALILQYLGPTAQSQKMALVNKPKMVWPLYGPIFRLLRLNEYYYPASPTFLQTNKILVIQYVAVRPIMTVFALITQVMSRFCSESMSIEYGHFWYMVICFISVTFSMYGLIILYLTIKDDIAEKRPLPKFLSIKIVIFLTMIQNMFLSVLVHYNVIPENAWWTSTNISNGIQSFLVCLEMFIASIFHIYAFSAAEYTGSVPTPILKAVIIAFNPIDILREMGRGIAHLIQSIRGRGAGMRISKDGNLQRGSHGTVILEPLGNSSNGRTLREEEEVIIEENFQVKGSNEKGYGTL